MNDLEKYGGMVCARCGECTEVLHGRWLLKATEYRVDDRPQARVETEYVLCDECFNYMVCQLKHST